MRPLLPLLCALLVACSTDETDGVVVTPAIEGTSPLALARGASFDFEVSAPEGVLGPVTVTSDNQKVVQVVTVAQGVAGRTARVTVLAVAEKTTQLTFAVAGQVLETRSVAVHSAVDVDLVLPSDGIRHRDEDVIGDVVKVEVGRPLELIALPTAADGTVLQGRGIFAVTAKLPDGVDAPAVPAFEVVPGLTDRLVLEAKAAGDYRLQLEVGGRVAHTLAYHAVESGDARAIEFFGSDEGSAPLRDERVCTAAGPLDATGRRIYSATVDWELDDVVQTVHGSHICYSYYPDDPGVTLRATYGSATAEKVVHGRSFKIYPAGAALE